MIVYGQNPVRELLKARPKSISVVYLAAGDTGPALRELYEMCRSRAVDVEERERPELDALAGREARHQGVVAISGEHAYVELEDLLDQAPAPPLLVVLDGVQDPRNLGAIARSAHALGAGGLVIGKDRAAPVTAAAVKASAGATEHLAIARVVNIARALAAMKERGVWTVGAALRDAPAPAAVDLTGPIALVLGSEGRGLRPLVERTCDYLVRIPMVGSVASLNVGVAAGILLYEAARQRRAKISP
jgi:23S rRNA (guanosine2251-2'-O)-methyltransferase